MRAAVPPRHGSWFAPRFFSTCVPLVRALALAGKLPGQEEVVYIQMEEGLSEEAAKGVGTLIAKTKDASPEKRAESGRSNVMNCKTHECTSPKVHQYRTFGLVRPD